MPILTCPSPSIVNPLLGTGNYVFSLIKFPELTFFIQEVQLPSITLGVATQSSSVHDIPLPGESMTYGQLDCTFVVDEKMTNYLAIHNWIVGLGYPEGHFLYQQLMTDAKNSNSLSELAKGYTDGVLSILGNNNIPIMQAQFVDCFPTNLSGMSFSTKNTDASPITAQVSFEYSYYTLTVV